MPLILDGMASLCCAASLEKQRFSAFALLTWLSWSAMQIVIHLPCLLLHKLAKKRQFIRENDNSLGLQKNVFL